MSIRLSPKHGLNPSLAICWWCGEESGEIVIPGMLKGDQEAPKHAIWNERPCPKCEADAKEYIFLYEAHDNETRTGKIAKIRDAALKAIFPRAPADMIAEIVRKRRAFVDPDTWKYIETMAAHP